MSARPMMMMTRVLAPACRAPGVARRRRAPVTLTRVKHGRVVAASREVEARAHTHA